jgi:hypothetical protein
MISCKNKAISGLVANLQLVHHLAKPPKLVMPEKQRDLELNGRRSTLIQLQKFDWIRETSYAGEGGDIHL